MGAGGHPNMVREDFKFSLAETTIIFFNQILSSDRYTVRTVNLKQGVVGEKQTQKSYERGDTNNLA